MRRGEVWEYRSISHVRRVLVVSADALNTAGYPVVVDVTDIEPSSPALLLLAVGLGAELGGWARCRSISTGEPSRFETLVGRASDEAMEQVDMALAAALSL
ncbi:type II toxin-antitoxin system PemK/MazF family toxin [Nocardia sp. NPDC050406]|uniref:type II toxin-antitoxin system PemK/MazF family toxin n=1 Tax=Nocardia sp. NPDC050406 TaxID=3364318 RepID=UPI0037B78A56